MQPLYRRFIEALKSQDWQCTLFPDGWWNNCCIEHDYSCADALFWMDKNKRKKADLELRNCANKAFPLIGELMYAGVRAFNLSKKILGRPEY